MPKFLNVLVHHRGLSLKFTYNLGYFCGMGAKQLSLNDSKKQGLPETYLQQFGVARMSKKFVKIVEWGDKIIGIGIGLNRLSESVSVWI